MLDGTAGISRAEERHRHSRSMIGAWPWSRFSPENVERSFGRRGIRSQNLNLENLWRFSIDSRWLKKGSYWGNDSPQNLSPKSPGTLLRTGIGMVSSRLKPERFGETGIIRAEDRHRHGRTEAWSQRGLGSVNASSWS